MKYLFFIAAFGLSATNLCAQHKTNEEAIAAMKAAGYSGHFNYKIEENKTVNVNYSFMPLEPATEVKFSLHTPNPRPLWFQITDKTGKVVAEWKPEQPKYLHRGTLDISSLKPGEYTYNIYWDKSLAHSVSFRKK